MTWLIVPTPRLANLATLAVAALAIGLGDRAAGADCLYAVNRMRAAIGLYPLAPDPRIQQNAQATADYMARRGLRGHTGRHRRVARAEGTGRRSGYDPAGYRFYTCLMNTRRHRYAGAATAVAGGRTYYVLQLR